MLIKQKPEESRILVICNRQILNNILDNVILLNKVSAISGKTLTVYFIGSGGE